MILLVDEANKDSKTGFRLFPQKLIKEASGDSAEEEELSSTSEPDKHPQPSLSQKGLLVWIKAEIKDSKAKPEQKLSEKKGIKPTTSKRTSVIRS